MTHPSPDTQALPPAALLLLSGGMDSTTLLWWMRSKGIPEIHTVSIDYGQRHRVELEFGEKLSQLAKADSHTTLRLDLRQIGGNPLTSDDVDVPAASEKRQSGTVVPFRNMLFVTMAAAHAEVNGLTDLYISPVRDDYEAYRDCRREFYDALQQALRLGATTESDLRIHTPFVTLWKSDVIKRGLDLRVPYEHTHTCYEGRRPACGVCDACVERIAAFRLNNAVDPLDYEIPVGWQQ